MPSISCLCRVRRTLDRGRLVLLLSPPLIMLRSRKSGFGVLGRRLRRCSGRVRRGYSSPPSGYPLPVTSGRWAPGARDGDGRRKMRDEVLMGFQRLEASDFRGLDVLDPLKRVRRALQRRWCRGLCSTPRWAFSGLRGVSSMDPLTSVGGMGGLSAA